MHNAFTHMSQLLELREDHGLFSTMLPVFDRSAWHSIIKPTGFIWICTPVLDLPDGLNALVSNALLGTVVPELQCTVHRMEMDVSISADRFLSIVDTVFPHGLDFIQSDKPQPDGLQLSSIPVHHRPRVMAMNDITLTFHRPGGGEPAIITSCDRDVVVSIIESFRSEETTH